jgi:hypothetical protein
MNKVVMFVGAAFLAAPAAAQQVGNDESTYADDILITSDDVTTCPYRLVGAVTIASGEDWMTNGYSRDKVHNKLRNAAKKLGADAVVLVKRGGTHISLWSWDRREYSGRAIRYVERSCAPHQ